MTHRAWLGIVLGLVAGPLAAQRPGTVTDLTVIGATDSALTVRWTEVASGTAAPATYSVRIGPAAGFAWWLLPDGPQVPGSGATPVNQTIRLTMAKLLPSTTYSVQLVAYTGVLGAATFGGLSNVVTAATVATPPKPPPPPPPPPASVTVTAVTIQPAFPTIIETQFQQLYGVVSRSDGSAIPTNARLTWASSNPTVATVTAGGVVQGMTAGTATITAKDSSGVIGTSALVVTAAAPFSANQFTIENATLPLFSGLFGVTLTNNGTKVARMFCTVGPP